MKRFLGFLTGILAIALLALIPSSKAYAEDPMAVYIHTTGSNYYFYADGDPETDDIGAGSSIGWDGSCKITLTNVTDMTSIELLDAGINYEIILVGTNSLTASGYDATADADYGIHSFGNLVISGDGTLNITANNHENPLYCLLCDKKITLESGAINSTMSNNNEESYIIGSNDVWLKGGSITQNSSNNPGGEIGLVYGIGTTTNALLVDNGTYTINSNGDYYSGFYYHNSYGALTATINGGTITHNDSNTMSYPYFIYGNSSSNVVTINGGTIDINYHGNSNNNAYAYPFYLYGHLNITGGTITIDCENLYSGYLWAEYFNMTGGSITTNISMCPGGYDYYALYTYYQTDFSGGSFVFNSSAATRFYPIYSYYVPVNISGGYVYLNTPNNIYNSIYSYDTTNACSFTGGTLIVNNGCDIFDVSHEIAFANSNVFVGSSESSCTEYAPGDVNLALLSGKKYLNFGGSAPTPPPAPNNTYYAPLVNELIEECASVVPGTEVAPIEWNVGDALPNEPMLWVLNNPQLSILYTFTYEDVEHTVLITARDDIDPTIQWYGPLYLLGKFGEYDPNAPKELSYTVVRGDTLSKIAKQFGTTVRALRELNSQIVDVNKIHPGMNLRVQ